MYDSFPLAFRIFNMDDLYLKLPPSGRVWKILGRRQKETLFMTPQRSTLHPLPNRIVIPGGRLVFVTTKTTFKGVFLFLSFRVFYRFREVYYWDTYWIVAGLLACHMVETARYFESHCVEYSLYCCLSMCYSFPLE